MQNFVEYVITVLLFTMIIDHFMSTVMTHKMAIKVQKQFMSQLAIKTNRVVKGLS